MPKTTKARSTKREGRLGAYSSILDSSHALRIANKLLETRDANQ
jgi:hypothetical protein